ncbi:hypothetical protein LQR31_00010, partial [Chromobacterium vaccinii]|uniref:hypothetical protein n=1 Tax=Chromobacterium vaccinii TaxID=1108595 RepID=UPI001E348FFA
ESMIRAGFVGRRQLWNVAQGEAFYVFMKILSDPFSCKSTPCAWWPKKVHFFSQKVLTGVGPGRIVRLLS